MCGRTACTLAPDEVCRSCSVRTVGKDGTKKYEAPQWRDHPGDHKYWPSYNVAPTRFTPVMISEHHMKGVKREAEKEEGEGEELPPQLIIQPMMWGLIPNFYKASSPTGHGYSTNNCRLEDLEEKKMFKPSLVRGQRCVVLCDGFYEWQAIKGSKTKQPYFIYAASQPEGIKIWDRSSWDTEGVWSEEEGWKGPQLLKMAGLFSRWTSSEGKEVMSYSVVTKAAEGEFSDLHHRVPAILNTDQEVQDWLNYGKVEYKEALNLLAKVKAEVTWHPVSTQVNNSRNQETDMNHPVDPKKEAPPSGSSLFMANWLKKGSAKVKNDDDVKVKEENKVKKEEDDEK
ncbi:hypothetical protein Pcinc_008472 [Petrolisthes cinctipes]|uniref:Abasic site processing protein HMCES n=1 Tax=Petrolisthes cinctipes TaxID=88211 RepID=A0AAE1G760_PETCI|nr:hypothetical protein Pcinc_008472 [Petrolisthes cinctipes]